MTQQLIVQACAATYFFGAMTGALVWLVRRDEAERGVVSVE